jgi:hypothetical protein
VGIYHVHGKALYAIIGEPNNRNRKPVTLARAIERPMIMDAEIAEPNLQWLGSEREKVEYFRCRTALRLAESPSLSFGVAPKRTIRDFPDTLPIGVNNDQRTHVFLYLVQPRDPGGLQGIPTPSRRAIPSVPDGSCDCWFRDISPRLCRYSRQPRGRSLQCPCGWATPMSSHGSVDSGGRWMGGGAGDDRQRFRSAFSQFHAPRY